MEWESLAVKIARSDNLPMLSQVASSVIRLADDSNGSPREMAKLIEQDPAMTAKVLKVANSAAYGASAIANMTSALNMLGMKTIRTLVVSLAYQQVVSGRQQAPGFSKLEFWQHSLGVAVAARILGKMKAPEEAEKLYLIGLIHDVGMLVLDRFVPAEFGQAVEIARRGALPLYKAELGVLGFTHAEVGGLLAEKWGLPHGISEPVLRHHQAGAEAAPETAILMAADLIAAQCGYGNNAKQAGQEEGVLASLELPEEQFEVIRTVVASEVAKSQEALQIR